MSEETKQSSEVKDEGLAQEALEATAEAETPPVEKPAEEPQVPLHKVTALRERAQQAEVAQARAEGELVALRSHQTSAVKSPLDLEIERQAAEGIAEEEMTVSPKVVRAQEVYTRQVANQTAQAEATQRLGKTQLFSANKARTTHEDWQRVISEGQSLLSQGELVDIGAAGDDYGEVAYAKCQAALVRNKPESKTNAAPEKKLSKSEAEVKAEAEAEAKAEKVPSQQEILKGIEGDPASIAAAQL